MAQNRGSVTGDFRALDGFIRQLQQSGKTQVLEGLADNLAEEVLELIAEGFEAQTDPYGQRWASRARDTGRPILSGKTARLRRGWFKLHVSSHGFVIANATSYAPHHQYGTQRGLVARRMVPTEGEIPPRWGQRFFAVASIYVRHIYS